MTISSKKSTYTRGVTILARDPAPELDFKSFQDSGNSDSGGRFFKNATVKQMSQLVLKTGLNEQVLVLTGSFVRSLCF